MNYRSVLQYLAEIEGLGIKLALQNISQVLEALGNPQRKFASILITGTNGKGSVGSMLASILREAGKQTGFYTSPHLIRHEERIAIGGNPISEEQFSCALTRVRNAIDRLMERKELTAHPTHFEVMTAAAFDQFAEVGVEMAVLEVGMGGRLDATVLARPRLSIITNVSLEHTSFLGDTVAAIAREKVGILPQGGTLLTASREPEAVEVFRKAAAEKRAGIHELDNYLEVSTSAPGGQVAPGAAPRSSGSTPDVLSIRAENAVSRSSPESGKHAAHLADAVPASGYIPAILTIKTPRRKLANFRVSLPGEYQKRNTLLAIAAADLLDEMGTTITNEAMIRGIRSSHWPGRFQIIEGNPRIILDGAHNPASCQALAQALSASNFNPAETTLVFGIHRTKDYKTMLENILPAANQVILTRGTSPKFRDPYSYAAQARKLTSSDVTPVGTLEEALSEARKVTPSKGTILITGSLYLVGDTMTHLNIDPFPQATPNPVTT
jgi:dihydrofolate synthase/folylpolyglutamate synthase